ncbi:DEAD/DEAH box helicase [[Mycoplasma] testudinis]|uniref:DEAD/DEAH box helicase n=1 Tax=[Mycoplasma] testudinis TaxID=33924 RepID=UPI00047F8BA0|nr:AAA domain-containing protein [[Mycoplasma] testudinis]
MTFTLSLNVADYVKEERRNKILEFCDEKTHKVKISTNEMNIEYDRKDARNIKKLKNVKLIYEKKNGGIKILVGDLGCCYSGQFGGEFYAKKIFDEMTPFVNINAVTADIKFTSIDTITSIETVQDNLKKLSDHPNFLFNLSQFDEFMEIFRFYKTLSNELNNNYSFEISEISEPYYFISETNKDLDSDFKKEVKDQAGVIKGYQFDESVFNHLNNNLKDEVKILVDVKFVGSNSDIGKIRKIGTDNIYVSNLKNVTEKDADSLVQFSITNILLNKKEVILSGEFKNKDSYDVDFKFLNLYDMGQKIKIDSIENSLKLINQGAAGPASELLEYLIGDVKMPTNNTNQLKNESYEKYLSLLNESQRKAFLMATDGSPISLIKGPPGTGKTHVINAIVRYITQELGEKVVITSQTHIAIDNVLDKLIENYDAVIPKRITNRKNRYGEEEIDRTLYRTWGVNFSSHNKRSKNTKLANFVEESLSKFKGIEKFDYSSNVTQNDYYVIGATTTTSSISGKKGIELLKGHDWLIIDEVSKCPITEVLRYLPYVKKIIMVGDDFQLPPLLEFSKKDVKDLEAYNEEKFEKLKTIYEQSVFAKVLQKAFDADRVVLLNENYRSVKDVLALYNLFYDNQLKNKREIVKPNKVHFISENKKFCEFAEKDIFFMDVKGGQEAKDGNSRYNSEEINATEWMLRRLIEQVQFPKDVTVSAIFPYAAQIELFQKRNLELINQAKKVFKSFEIDTVDAFQGKESDIVLLNTVVTTSDYNFLNDFRRINVSMSRARDKLIVFGNERTLSNIEMSSGNGRKRKYFKDIIQFIKTQGYKFEYNNGEVKNETIRSKSSSELA